MVRFMRNQEQYGTQSLISAVRNRLWLQCAADILNRGVWIGCGILISGGLYHLFVHALQIGILITLGMLPLAAGLLVVLFRHRPGSNIAARTADIWFDGKNLITSAWELHQQCGGHSAMDKLVMRRAQTAALHWRRRIASERPVRWPHRMTMPLLLALTGIFLLQLPSKEWLTWSNGLGTDRVAGFSRASSREGSQRGVDARYARDVASLREEKETATAHAFTPPITQDSSAALAADQAALGKRQRGDVADNGGVNKPDRAPLAGINSAVSTNNGGNRAGYNDGVGVNPYTTKESSPLQVREVGIQRMAGTQGSTGNGDELRDIQSPYKQALSAAVVVPAARHTRVGYRADYTPALRLYMARYFQKLNAQESQP
jgi:hypothetical protein